MSQNISAAVLLQPTDHALAAPDSQTWGWIYTDFFGLKSPPFSLLPDRNFFYCHASAQETLNTLYYSLCSDESIIKVTGAPGIGKTVLCNTFFSALDAHFIVLKIVNPNIDSDIFLKAILDEFSLPYPMAINAHQLVKYLESFLLELHKKRQCRVVVYVDEAHQLPEQTLEIIRILSNLQTQDKNLLQFVLVGQPALDNKLKGKNIVPLRQRISFSGRLIALTRAEAKEYVLFRFARAGLAHQHIFTRKALKLLHWGSAGLPRLINIIGHKSMLIAYGEGKQTITDRHVIVAIKDTESTRDRCLRRTIIRHSLSYLACGIAILIFIHYIESML